jgi:hypothetical protein
MTGTNYSLFLFGIWNLEFGIWNLGFGVWNLEYYFFIENQVTRDK